MNLWNFFVQNRLDIADLTLEHLWMVGISTLIAVAVGLPLGILISRKPVLRDPVIATANIIQTIPILALTLYALLPLIRHTYAGIEGVDRAVVEAARGMGLTDWQLLFKVQLPLASGVILAGIRVAVVISVGLATIAAAIGAGGLGELIFRGLAMVNNSVILAGAIPAALMALAADVLLGWF